MKAVFCEKFGGPKDLVVKEIEPPDTPKPDEVQINLKYRGIAFADLVRMAGNYQDNRTPPYIVGGDGSGIITCVGKNVTSIKPGDKVEVFDRKEEAQSIA